MKLNQLFICVFALSVLCFPAKLKAQDKVWFLELQYQCLGNPSIQNGGLDLKKNYSGYGLTLNHGGEYLGFIMQVDLRSFNLQQFNVPGVAGGGITEEYIGIRYYPLIPTVRIGTKFAMRFTAGALAGLYQTAEYDSGATLWSTYNFSLSRFGSLFFAGFCFSSLRNTSGISIKLNYQPNAFTMNDFVVKQPFTIRLGVLLGTKAEQ
jgi:hypothetical protein